VLGDGLPNDPLELVRGQGVQLPARVAVLGHVGRGPGSACLVGLGGCPATSPALSSGSCAPPLPPRRSPPPPHRS
jgi:hypothetical protein